MIEKSIAVSCPSIAYQLCGTKKIQQVLFDRKILEKFVIKEEAMTLMKVFAPQYAITEESKKLAIASPDKFVMKPQLEGGGNLKFGDDMVEILKGGIKKVQDQYILMSMITPIPFSAFILRDGVVKEEETVYELGAYTCFVSFVLVGGLESSFPLGC